MLAICGSHDHVLCIDAAVTELFSKRGSLRTYLEEKADLGAGARGKMRKAIFSGSGSDGLMAAARDGSRVRVLALER
eukprot:4970787-Pleurochrysis_carterae.AAC.1